MLLDNEAITKLARQNMNLAEKVVDRLEELSENIRKAFEGVDLSDDIPVYEAARAVQDFFDEAKEKWGNALIAAQENYNAEQKTGKKISAEGGRVQNMAIKYPKFSENEIRKNAEKLGTMDVVKRLTGNEFVKDSTPLDEKIREYFASLGNNIYSDVFGDVALTNSSIRSERRHGYTPPKIVAFAALPEVIKNGVVIESFEKNRGVDRIVVAAPIRIGKEKYYMGVMLQRDVNSQRLYMHDVVIEKETSSEVSGILDSTGPSLVSGNLYMTNILLNALKVKGGTTEKSKSQKQVLTPNAKQLENELNSAGLLLTSKENNKSNRRINAYINEHYPELQGKVRFVYDNSTGRVTVERIVSDEEVQARNTRIEQEYAREQAEKKFWEKYHTQNGVAKLEEMVSGMLKRNGINADVEHSHSSVGSLSFYVRTEDGKTIKISDHNTIGQELIYKDTAFINLHELASAEELYDRILRAIDSGEEDNINLDVRFQKLGISETAEEQQARKDSVENLKAERELLRERKKLPQVSLWEAPARAVPAQL